MGAGANAGTFFLPLVSVCQPIPAVYFYQIAWMLAGPSATVCIARRPAHRIHPVPALNPRNDRRPPDLCRDDERVTDQRSCAIHETPAPVSAPIDVPWMAD
jgi:hypothetical protein